MDRPDANADRIKTQLTEHNLVPREYGGDVECVPISAKAGTGVDDLLEHILFVSDVLELRADPHGRAAGVIVEARQEVGRGAVATALVQEGTLRIGDCVVSGLAYGKIRAMTNDRGERLHKATPAMPVELIGLSSVPQAGDRLETVKDEREARQVTTKRAEQQRDARLTSSRSRITLEDISRRVREGEDKELRLVVKADVQGSVEAVVGALNNLPQDEIGLRVIHSGVGTIGENDVMLASASSAVILGFNVRSDQPAQAAAEREHVDIRTYQVIYELTESVERAMKGMLAPVYEEVALGKVEIRATFRTPRGTIIAGCYVTDGKVTRNCEARVRRGRDVIYQGRVDSLRHLKDDVREMAQGFECGIVMDGFSEFQVGDVIEAFETRQVERA
jgi:translation initiation factor IF-2